MARPATPTNILEMRGAYKNHPERKKDRNSEPEVSPIKRVSKYLTKEEKVIWKEILGYMPEGVIGISDTPALETLCKLIYIMRFNFNDMTAAQLNKLETLLGRFGMTPSDRTKIVVKKTETKSDPWADL